MQHACTLRRNPAAISMAHGSLFLGVPFKVGVPCMHAFVGIGHRACGSSCRRRMRIYIALTTNPRLARLFADQLDAARPGAQLGPRAWRAGAP